MRVVWWMLAVVVVCSISIFLSERRTLDPLQNLSLTVTAPAAGELRNAAAPANDFLDGVIDRGDLVRENRELKETVAGLQAQIAEQQDAKQRVLELEEALGVKQGRQDDQLLAANVIAEEPSGLNKAIAIDRGLSDGIDEGMVVLSRSGVLVGTVSRAYQDFAWIRLITDPDSAVNAQVNVIAPEIPAATAAPTSPPGSTPAPQTASPSPTPAPPPPVRGVAEGDLRQAVILDLLPSDAAIAEGTLVVTSGLGGNYPPGLLIGSVDLLEQRPQSPFTRAILKPAAGLAGLDTVLVLISFRPARLTSP